MKRVKSLLAILLAGIMTIPQFGLYAEELTDGEDVLINKSDDSLISDSAGFANESIFIPEVPCEKIGYVGTSSGETLILGSDGSLPPLSCDTAVEIPHVPDDHCFSYNFNTKVRHIIFPKDYRNYTLYDICRDYPNIEKITFQSQFDRDTARAFLEDLHWGGFAGRSLWTEGWFKDDFDLQGLYDSMISEVEAADRTYNLHFVWKIESDGSFYSSIMLPDSFVIEGPDWIYKNGTLYGYASNELIKNAKYKKVNYEVLPDPTPTAKPTATPTPKPSAKPTVSPTPKPTAAPEPTKAPTVTPTPLATNIPENVTSVKIPSTPVTKLTDEGSGNLRVYWRSQEEALVEVRNAETDTLDEVGSSSLGTIKGVTGYQIRWSKDPTFETGTKTGSYQLVNNTTRQGLDVGSTYYVGVRTYATVNGKNYYSGWSGTKSLTLSKKLNTPSIGSIKKVKNGTASINWNKVAGVDGYQLRFSQKSSFSGAKTASVKGAGTTTYKRGSMIAGQWYVSVRAYKNNSDGTRYYSTWSKSATIKI